MLDKKLKIKEYILTKKEQKRRIAELREKAILDERSHLRGAYEEGEQKGIEKGMQKGMEKGTIIIANRLLKEGLDIEIISKVTQMDVKKIRTIAKNLNR